MNITMRTKGAAEVRALAGRFRQGGRGLQPRLVQALHQDAAPALAAVRSAFLGVQVSSSRGGGSSSGLRARVAAATRVETIPTGVQIAVDPAAVDSAYGKALSFGLDGLGRWRHPVWGNTRLWEQQYGQEVFYSTLTGRSWETGLGRVVDQVAREIEG